MPRNVRVLLVDDDVDWVTLTGRQLEATDDSLAVITAVTVAEARAVFEGEDVDCVVCDYQLPESNGIEFLRWIRAERGEFPFVLITASGSEAVASEAIAAHVTDYFVKEPSRDQSRLLATRIHNAVETYRTARELEIARDAKATIQDVLVGASSRADIERALCELLVEDAPYRLAWVAEGSATDALIPRAWAGDDRSYVDAITGVPAGDEREADPTGRAWLTGSPQFVGDVGDADGSLWKAAALEAGFLAVAAVPVVHDDVPYGVLTVCSARPNSFDEPARRSLSDLAESLGYAIGVIERRTSLSANRVVDVDVRVVESGGWLSTLAGDVDGDVAVSAVIPRGAETVCFVEVDREVAGAFADHVASRLGADAVTPIDESSDRYRYQVTAAGDALWSDLAEHGGVIRSIRATDGATEATLEFPATTDVHGVLATLRERYPDLAILSYRDRDRPWGWQSPSSLPGDLTDKQREALQAAYHGGYFDRPRRQSADEVAATLGVSRSTFLQHLHAAQRKTFGALLE